MRHVLLIVILAALSMLGALSIDAYLPALPTIAHHFRVNLSDVQQTLSAYLSAFAIMTLFYGTLSDSFGRRPVILLSSLIYFFSSLGAGFSLNLSWLLFFRVLQGLSAGAGAVIGRAMIGDLLAGAEAQRMMSYVSMVFGLAPAIAPILGGWLMNLWGWRSIFYFISGFSCLLSLVCWFYLTESLPRGQRHPFSLGAILRSYLTLASHPRFLFYCLGIAFSFSGVMLYVGSAPSYIFDVLHLGATDFGWLFIPLIGGMTLGSWFSARLSHRLTSATIIWIGYLIMGGASLMSVAYQLAFVPRLPWIVLPLFAYAIGMALASPAMIMTTLALFPNHRGLAASMQTFIFMLIFALSSGLFCPLLFGSGLKLSLGVLLGYLISIGFWFLKSRAENIPLELQNG